MSMSPNDEDAVVAAADLVGRTGASHFEIGDTDGWGTWYAHAQYQGRRVTCDSQHGPVEAAEGLARELLDGGSCMHCGGVITLAGDGGAGTCRWARTGRRWDRHCHGREPAVMPARIRLALALKEIPGIPADLMHRAAAGHYGDYTGDSATPKLALRSDLVELAARPATPRNSRALLRDLAQQVTDGAFDDGKDEAAAWWSSDEGRATAKEFGLHTDR